MGLAPALPDGGGVRRKRVLVVDDSPFIRKVACRMVEALGFAADEAENGAAALQACGDRMPDAVLLDWAMPVMDGLACLAELRQLAGGGHVKVVFCTGTYAVDQIARALEAGADEYIMKPFDQAIIGGKFAEIGLGAS